MLTVKIKKTFLPAAAVAVSLYFMFAMPYSVSKGVTLGLKICFYTILPSLFPFMVLSTYIVKSDILSPIYKIISPITKVIFKQPPCAAGVIIMSLIGGFPVGAKMTMTLLESEKITENQAQRLNLFCVNCGPAFAITAIGVSIYKSQRAGVIIYASLCLSSIILGILSSFLNDKNTVDNKTYNTSQSPLAALSASVGDTVQAVLSVCAWIVIFSAISSCIESSGIDEKLHIAISCLLEVTNGCTLAAGRFSIPAVTAVIGFGDFAFTVKSIRSYG